MKGRQRRPIALFDGAGMTEELRRSLNMIIVAVLFGMVWANITTGAAWTGYLRALGADEFALGIIAAIPVAASAIQLLASYILERSGKRRELFIYIGIVSRLLWVPIGLIPYVVPMDAMGLRMTLIMMLLAMTAASGAFINVGFFSLVGDLVPMRIRGRYFGTRSAISLVASVLTGLLVSFLMDHVEGYIGYTIVFVLAGVAGAMDILCFFRVSWPKMHKDPGEQKSLVTMVREVFQNKPYRKLVITFTFWSFSVNIAAPFFNVYMLEQIGMSYTEITLLNQVLPNVVAVFVMSWWGRRMDECGNKPVMQLTGLHYMLYPFFWIFTGPRAFLILPFINTLSGLLGPAFDLGAQNMYLGQASERNRSMYVAVFFASTQLLGSALANAVGGYLVQNVLPHLEALNITLFGFRQTRYQFIFLISSLLRIVMILGFLPRLADAGCKSMRSLIVDIYLGLRDKVVFTVKRAQVQLVRRRVHRLRRLRRQAREQARLQNLPPAEPLPEVINVPEATSGLPEREHKGGIPMEQQSNHGALQQRKDIDAQWKWRLEDIFETDTAWEAAYQALSKRLPSLDGLPEALKRGKDGILEAVKTSFEVKRAAERLIGYASMRRDEDNRNPVYQGLADRAHSLAVSAESKLAFLEPALLVLPEALLTECIEDPAFAEYDVYLRHVQRDRAHTLPADQEKLLALAGEVLDAPSIIYDMLTDADMRFPTILDEKGEPVEITHARFRKMLLSHDRRVRREAFEAVMETYHKFGNTIASAYAKSVKGDCFEAKIRHFDSSLAMTLHPDEVPLAVYDNLIEAMHEHLPALNRYVLQRKKDLGLDEIHLYDLYVNPIKDFDLPLTYPEAYDTVLKALAPLGEDYVNVLREARAQGWVDVYESEGKTSGAYSWGVYGVHPYVLLNHQNVLDGTSTLAHELGHAMHSYLSNAALPYTKAHYSLFAAEVASTVNEILLSCYLMDQYPQREAQAFLINELLEGFRGTVYRQTLFAEFERESHAMAERDEALTGQALSDMYYGIYQRYYGESCAVDDCVRHEWMRIPHFYRAFYVYKYATGFSAAVYIARRILREGAPAVAEYMRFLKAGGSLPPIEALRLAGVDMAGKEAVNEALDWFGELVDRFAALQQA